MHNTNDLEQDLLFRKTKLFITPSWLSGVIAIVLGLVMTAGLVIIINLKDNGTIQAIDSVIKARPSHLLLTLPGQNSSHDTSSLASTWPLLAFWAFIGLIAFVITEEIVKSFTKSKHFLEELHYVNARPKDNLRFAIIKLSTRLAILITWLVFTNLFFKEIMPWSIKIANTYSQHLEELKAYEKLAESFIVTTLCLHLHTVFMRATIGKPRLFTSANYLDT
jgi:hypothetical protein